MTGDGFHASAVFHPDMLRLQGLLFGAQEFEFNQCQLLVRPPGWGGQHYHAHLDGSEADEGPHVGPTTPGPYSQARHVIFTFVYPDGFEGNGQDGALKIVPGSHLWCVSSHPHSGERFHIQPEPLALRRAFRAGETRRIAAAVATARILRTRMPRWPKAG